jgi:hypothetical protein
LAGRPRERALVLELEQRARVHFEGEPHTILDYVCEWLADGKTMRALGNELSDKVNLDLSHAHIMAALTRHFDKAEVTERLAEARERGAYAMVDDAVEDAVRVKHKDDVPAVRVRNDARFWTAQRFNRRNLGEPKPGVNVTLNVAALHLDAMRQRSTERVSEAESPMRVRSIDQRSLMDESTVDESGAIAGAIVEDAQVLSIEDTTS